MTSVSPTSPAGVQAPPSRKTLRKVAFASFAGTTIEFYDFFIYGTAAALVFPVVFFPALGAAAGTIASFGTFAVAFSLYPVSVADLMAVSDANAIMPPKSTWFEPKLRDGLLIHVV